MPPWSVAAPLAGLFPGTSLVPATFLESVPSLKLTLVFPINEQSKPQFLSGGQASQADPNALGCLRSQASLGRADLKTPF
jgi:hypothetical protein